MLAHGWLDHYRYAESALRRLLGKGYGPMRVMAELTQKGIPEAIQRQVLAESEPDWFELAQQAYNKRFSDTAIGDRKDWAKRARYLSYRGFTNEQIMEVLTQASGQCD
ncbi:regulatory protein RecX [Gallaecimonas sp. GXIMD4217]|uniref:regulatory protein RecX n=2 Tax=Gallaecimonas sp. GXIMD4217 TaxID=3131927 RepID=UPI00311AF7C0